MDLKISIPVEILEGDYRKYYSLTSTVMQWQQIWTLILDMTYRHGTPIRSIIVEKEGHEIYQSRNIVNHELLTFDYIWREYTGETDPVLEFEELYVPYELFYCGGIKLMFAHAFPNCKVTYW